MTSIKITGKESLHKSPTRAGDASHVDSPYAWYVLGVMMLVYVFNFVDRQILSILAEDIKADLVLTDADMGFMFGAAFAVFYAVFGLPLARLADNWNRKKLVSIGIGFWSLMTALSGLSKGLFSLAFCRFGVGVGEAGASPAIYSIIYDYFSPKWRATAVAIYASGIYIGSGLGLIIGGLTLDAWNAAYPDPTFAPFGLKGWQASFMIVGLPGVVLALWFSTIKEPKRGISDNIISKAHPHPFSDSFSVLLGLLPIANIGILLKECGVRGVVINFLIGAIVFAVSYFLVIVTGNYLQWITFGVGIYSVSSWIQLLINRDPVAFHLIFRCKALMYTLIGGAGPTFTGIGIGFWAVPFLQRNFEASVSEIGSVLGIGFVTMGLPGMLLGGWLSDRLMKITPKGKLVMLFGASCLSVLSTLMFLTTQSLTPAYTGLYASYFFGAMAIAPTMSTVNDLVIPRIRGTVTAFSLMLSTLLASALAPYVVGKLSDAIAATGISTGESLRQGMLLSLVLAIVGLFLIVLAFRHIERDQSSLLRRAIESGEKV